MILCCWWFIQGIIDWNNVCIRHKCVAHLYVQYTMLCNFIVRLVLSCFVISLFQLCFIWCSWIWVYFMHFESGHPASTLILHHAGWMSITHKNWYVVKRWFEFTNVVAWGENTGQPSFWSPTIFHIPGLDCGVNLIAPNNKRLFKYLSRLVGRYQNFPFQPQ